MTKNDYMMNIYSTDSISRGLWYGSYILFAFPCIMDRLGLIAHGAVNAGEHADYFIGSDRRFYSMPIGQKPMSIGDQIARQVFKDEFVSRSYKHYTVCGKFDFKDRILFCIPDVSTTNNFPTKIYVYDIINKRWEYFVFAHEIRAFAYSGYLESTLFMEKNCIVYELDEPATGLMGASEIACEYQTEDVTIDEEHSNARWKWFTFTAKSSIASKTVVVQYSTDNGSTWTAFDDSPISLTSSWVTHRIPLDVVSRVIRFRFTQTSGDLQIKANMFYGFSPDTEE